MLTDIHKKRSIVNVENFDFVFEFLNFNFKLSFYHFELNFCMQHYIFMWN